MSRVSVTHRARIAPIVCPGARTSSSTRDARAHGKKNQKRKQERAAKRKKELEGLASRQDQGEDEDETTVGASSRSGAAPHETPDMVFHALDLGGSYKTKTGEKLLTGNVMVHDAAKALFSAPFACASHDKDDVFNYGNKAALALWELPWEEFVGMKSTKSADEGDSATQAERRALLDQAASDGVITNYTGVRMSSTGAKFRIENATVWTMNDSSGTKTGQAVRFDRVIRLNDDGSDGDVRVVDEEGNWVAPPVVEEPPQIDESAVRERITELTAAVDAQAVVVRGLKDGGLTNADDEVKAAVKILLDLKSELSNEEAKID